jgi:hypothetical protein
MLLTECQVNEEEYSKAADATDESYSGESLFMALIFQQQHNKISSLLSYYTGSFLIHFTLSLIKSVGHVQLRIIQ